MLNPIFWKKAQGQKQPGRWGIVEHQIPSIKVLFKTNAKSHKHPGIKLSSSESQTQLVNQRKHIYIFIIYIYSLTQSFWAGTKVIRWKRIIQPTGFCACSSTCCQWGKEDVPMPLEWSNSHPRVRVQKSCVNQFIHNQNILAKTSVPNSQEKTVKLMRHLHINRLGLQEHEKPYSAYHWSMT